MDSKGVIMHELPPSEDNQRNSEGAFISLNDGRLFFAYSRYSGGGFRDESRADIAAIVSADGGNTWSEPRILVTAESHGALNVMSVSLLRMQNGDVGLFYLVKHGFEDTRLELCRSADEGDTWSAPLYCVERLGFNVVNNDRVVRTASGRLLIPSAHHGIKAQPPEPAGFPIAVDYFYGSDDDGKTWFESPVAVALNSPHTAVGLQEPGVVELHPGLLWAWARTDMGRQYEFFSRDNGLTWDTPVPSRFTSPCSPLSMKRVPGTDCLLAVWNPIAPYPTIKLDIPHGDRKRLVYALGRDNGARWSDPVILEDADWCGYCYTAIHFLEDAVLLGYCAGDDRDYSILSNLRIRKIPLRELPL